MAELRNTEQYISSYETLLKEVTSKGITAEDLNMYLSHLSSGILQKIEESGVLPMYSFEMIITELMCYPNENENGHVLDLMCTFQPIKEFKPDMIIDNSFLFPKSARATIDTIEEEIKVTVSWKEYFNES